MQRVILFTFIKNSNIFQNENEHHLTEEEEHREAMRHNIEVQGMKCENLQKKFYFDDKLVFKLM